MSTLPGVASKGEKSKQKFQSLDINNLYRVSRGENLEKQQQKSTVTYKHGMQSLGKVPSARRAPANLPSLKSEHSGSDASVPLVPPGGPGWGKQDSTTTTSSTSTTVVTTTASTQSTSPPQLTSHQAAIALPVTTTIPPPIKHPTVPATPATTDKSWSAVMSGPDPTHPPLYQSPQFQHEFPSLSVGDGAPIRTGPEAQYTPGLSLRPQTEGSWIQGGSRPGTEGAQRSSSVPLGAPPQLPAQVGLPQQQLPPQFRAVMPNFMYKGSFAPGAPGTPTQTPPMNGRNGRPENRGPPRMLEGEDITPRPIIKEEELSRMDEINKDMGWAGQDDIDYNQKLAFSDDESGTDKTGKRDKPLMMMQQREQEKNDGHEPSRNWNASGMSRQRSSDEELWKQRRNQHNKDLEQTVLRAKQRKEEEEKRFNEATKQGAAKKLMELEEKMSKRNREEEGVGTISPSVVPPKPINPTEIPLPDFQREKEKDRDRESRSRTPNESSNDEKTSNSFRQLTQIEGKNFAARKHAKNDPRDRDREMREQNRESREQNGPSFSRHFQSHLPPRFQRQKNPGPNIQGPMHFPPQQFERGWISTGGGPNVPKPRQESPGRDRELEEERRDKRQGSEDSQRSSQKSQSDVSQKTVDNRFDDVPRQDYDYERRGKEDDKWHVDRRDGKFREDRDRHERPQRPDSRDSRASRDSRHSRDSARESEPREIIGSWAESVFEPPYEEKRRDHARDDRRQVPGPITKDRIEADDMKNEKRSLTQLKRGHIPEKKILEKKDEKVEDESDKKLGSGLDSGAKAWADAVSPTTVDPENPKFMDAFEASKHESEAGKRSEKSELEPKDDKRNRNRNYAQSKGWNSEYHRSGPGWSKRPPSRGLKSGGSQRSIADADSEGSVDDSNADRRTLRKSEKDDKNKEIKHDKFANDKQDKKDSYVPRGEPSRHGRGGGNFRSRGGLSRRIDGYGPPPSKSPFGHHDDKEKKLSSDENATDLSSADDKAKQNQQALSAGIAGRKETSHNFQSMKDDKSRSRKPDNRRVKPKPKTDGKKDDDNVDSNSDNSASKRGSTRRINNAPPRFGGEKKPIARQNSSSIKKDEKSSDAISDAKNNEVEQGDEGEEKVSSHGGDSDGFQEVKSKKAVKERQKSLDDKPKSDKDLKKKTTTSAATGQLLTQQQISSIPPLMATPVNPPPALPPGNKNQFERPRQSKLAPRFAKQRETNRLQKAQIQQQQNICEVNDLNKVNQNMNVFNVKDQSAVVASMTNAWDKSLGGTQLRGIDDNVLGVSADGCKAIEHVQAPSQSNSPNTDKAIGKSNHFQDKAMLDGATPPVNTIIFENTNFKSAPGPRNARPDKPRPKLEDGIDGSVVVSSFAKPIGDLLCKTDPKSDPIQIPLSFKEDAADIKLDFFETDLSHLTEDKSSTKNLCMPRIGHSIASSGNSAISTADALKFKIQSVQKMWETGPDHGVGPEDTTSSFSNSFQVVSDPNSLDPNAFKGNEATDDNEGYSPSPNQVAANNTTNVCKVKPTQQVSGSGGQAVLSSANHQQHSGIMGPSLMGNPLSPPPLQAVIGSGVTLGQPPQQFTSNQHIGYQAGLGGSNQFGIPAIPSPPTVMYNSTQPLQQTPGLYGPFQIDQSGVLGGQGRSQYSQYPSHYNLGQTASSPYSTQSVYLQTTQHPPPTAQAPPDLYQNLSNYRLSATGHFGQNQQLNNPTTVLISSTSNSLMSASVKPSSQPISAIGTKAGGVGQAYQQQSQQSQQVYAMYDPSIQANYLSSAAGVMQRGHTGPVQNNVALQPSSSYYSGSTGQTGYFQQPGSSTIQSAQLQQHQAGYGLQGNMFGTHSQSHTNAGLQSFNSHFLSTPIQLAAALNAQQQYRSGMTTQYMKNVGNQQINDQTGRSQQLKSPGTQEVLSSVFNTGSQISSPKLRQNCKQPPPQPSPTAQHKYNLYQSVGNQQSGNMQRYPNPIQRPVNYQQNLGSVQNSSGQKHRAANNASNKAPPRQYYQSNSISSQNDKVDDGKLNENSLTPSNPGNTISSVAAKAIIGTNSTSVNSSAEISKDAITIEESSALKD